jgi:4-hydroxybenzoate polyprenyltransferase
MFLKSFFKLIRPKHWVKNFFVIAPLIFTLKFMEIKSILLILKAFISFCLVASSIYILNDIVDKNNDKIHPKKKFRPIASGNISISRALFIFLFIFSLSCIFAFLINLRVLGVILLYFFINILYSFKYKKVVILDVFFIAFGFILRIYAGSFAINVNISHWIILTTFFVSLFLGFGKRLNEINLLSEKNNHRHVLRFYSKDLLNNFLIITSTLTIISYALYTIDPRVISKFGTDNLIYSVPLVVFGVFRYLYLVFQEKKGGDVAETVMRDLWIIFTCLIWCTFIITVLFFKI